MTHPAPAPVDREPAPKRPAFTVTPIDFDEGDRVARWEEAGDRIERAAARRGVDRV